MLLIQEMDAPKILLADPCASVRLGINSLLLDTANAEIVGEASTTMETLRLYAALRPEWIILDLDLDAGLIDPRAGNSATPVNVIRKLKSFPQPPCVIVYTFRSSLEDVVLAAAAGADHYVHKSTDYKGLVRVRRRICTGKRVWLPYKRGEELTFRLDSTLRSMTLTPREKEILVLKARRLTNLEIAKNLYISVNTVKHHVTSIRNKLPTVNLRDLL